MASWNEPPRATKDKSSSPSATAIAVERARRLLEQLFTGRPRDDRPPRPKQ